MYGNTEGQTGHCWHSVLRLWEGDRRFEIISSKRPQGGHEWPGCHSSLMWYSSRWELQAHSLRFPVPGGRWGSRGSSWGQGNPVSQEGASRRGNGCGALQAQPGSARRKNRWCSPLPQWKQKYPKTKEHWPYLGQALPAQASQSQMGHVTGSKPSFMLCWK